jgi:hypothetical protein
MNNSSITVLWMGNEALVAGLDLDPPRVIVWEFDKLRDTRPSESLTFFWRLFELFPFKRLSFRDAHHETRYGLQIAI